MARLFANLVKEPSLTSKNGQLEFLRALLSEFLGTLLFVLISTGAVCRNTQRRVFVAPADRSYPLQSPLLKHS